MEFGFEQYERMAELARTVQGSVLISINDHPDIRRVFDGLYIDELAINYTVGGGAGTPARELLIWNQHCEDRRRETGTLSLF